MKQQETLEAAYLCGFEPSEDGLSQERLLQEAQNFLSSPWFN